jgi:hypothetical protein
MLAHQTNKTQNQRLHMEQSDVPVFAMLLSRQAGTKMIDNQMIHTLRLLIQILKKIDIIEDKGPWQKCVIV